MTAAILAKALIFVREVAAISSAACRDINRVETLVASGHLRRLRDLGLLDQKGTQTHHSTPQGRPLRGSSVGSGTGSSAPLMPPPCLLSTTAIVLP